ncbi:MAG TPA: tRNA 5-methoxyuridine(34)/uridine 5-oxyacetic acid(34) synthase CmoB [Pseudomonadales bacterium]
MKNISAIYEPLYETLAHSNMQSWPSVLREQVAGKLNPDKHGDLPRWLDVIESLPARQADRLEFDCSSITAASQHTEAEKHQLKALLMQLSPWRKGPYHFHGVDIDTEWRSDFKWERLKNAITPLTNRLVLDVGCGNGYHCWRMRGAGARTVIGIDPSILAVLQYHAARHFTGEQGVYVLPLRMEDVPANLSGFDTVFSMGVLYHRRSPLDHLLELKNCLRPGGELVLESLVIEGGANQVLVPEDRYGKMRNVWFLPSCDTLQAWLVRCGYTDVRLINLSQTTGKEQRQTEWMRFESLQDFLHPDNPELTVEGLPAPRRAIFTAQKPQ